MKRGTRPLRTLTKLPRGPRALNLIRSSPQIAPGPGQPPPGFLNGQNSRVEWIAYWALARIFDNPKNPWQGPFIGGPGDWMYQVPEMGAYLRSLNSAVVDFVVTFGKQQIAIRIQTERFHTLADAKQQQRDIAQRLRLEREGDVIDVYDDELMGLDESETAQKAIVTMKRAIGMIERTNPITAGTARRTRY